MDGGASAASSVINATLRISQIIFELAAVGEQARDLLAATKHVSRAVETTRILRRQKSKHLESTEKSWIDNVMIDASNTLDNVATLVEPVRVDMQVNQGRIGLKNRGLFVLRDSPKVPTQLTQLSITSQSLNAALSLLAQREGSISPRQTHLRDSSSIAILPGNSTYPPTYEEAEFLNRRRSSIFKQDSRGQSDHIKQDTAQSAHSVEDHVQKRTSTSLSLDPSVEAMDDCLRRDLNACPPQLLEPTYRPCRPHISALQPPAFNIDCRPAMTQRSSTANELPAESVISHEEADHPWELQIPHFPGQSGIDLHLPSLSRSHTDIRKFQERDDVSASLNLSRPSSIDDTNSLFECSEQTLRHVVSESGLHCSACAHQHYTSDRVVGLSVWNSYPTARATYSSVPAYTSPALSTASRSPHPNSPESQTRSPAYNSPAQGVENTAQLYHGTASVTDVSHNPRGQNPSMSRGAASRSFSDTVVDGRTRRYAWLQRQAEGFVREEERES